MRQLQHPIVPFRPPGLPVFRQSEFDAFGGFAGTTGTAASGAASGAATGASIGSVVPGVGTAIGAIAGGIVGGITGLLGGKSNPQIQIDKTNALNLFSQYTAIAGTVSGRSIGYENMDMIFRGACFAGHFPDWMNNGGGTELPDSLMSMPGSPYGQNDNCFAVLWSAAQTGRPAPGGSGVNTGNNGAPVRDAKTFVDNYVWPANSPDVDTDPWATNTDAIGKQVIYDAADAYIATQSPSTTPYIASAPAATSTVAPGSGAAVNAPRTATPTTPPASTALSPAGTALVIGVPGSMNTPQGVWNQTSGGDFTLNGSPVTTAPTATTEGTVGLLYMNQQTYAYNSDGSTYVWMVTAWQATPQVPTPSAAVTQAIQHYASAPAAPASTSGSVNAAANAVPQAPPTPTVALSADGSQVTAPGTALETSGGTLLYFGTQAPGDPNNASGYPIWEMTATSSSSHSGYAVGMVIGNGGNIYAVSGSGTWFHWVTSGWVQLASAPNLNGPAPTTSTVSSAQSGVSCTVGSLPSTTGSVVATTAAGDAITDDDIQGLISSMSAQNASAQQIYSAVLQTLQDQGANVSAGVQSQVASQVSASVPTATATPAASNNGLVIVGGGLAVLAVLYFMNRRKA